MAQPPRMSTWLLYFLCSIFCWGLRKGGANAIFHLEHPSYLGFVWFTLPCLKYVSLNIHQNMCRSATNEDPCIAFYVILNNG